MAQSALKGCEVCERGSGNNFCLDCEQFLCDDCRKCHTRLKFSKNHQFKSDSSTIPEVKSRCKEHNDEFLFLCVQCNIPVCRRCVSGAHKGHDMSNIDDVIAELKISARKTIESKSKLNDDVIETLVKGMHSLESDELKAIKEIKKEGVKMKQLIDQETERKIALCKEKVNREKEKMNHMLFEARELKKTETDLRRQLDELRQNAEDVSLVEKLKTHMESVYSMTNLSEPTLPSVTYASKSIKLDDIRNLMGIYTIQEFQTDTKPTEEKKQTLDDGFIIYHGIEQELIEFFMLANSHHRFLKFTYEIPNTETNFLDVHLFKGRRFLRDNILDIKTYFKPTNSVLYLHRMSCHKTHVFRAFIYGEVIRYRRTTNNDEDLLEILNGFKLNLIKRGYKKCDIEECFTEALSKERNTLIQTKPISLVKEIPLVMTTKYNPCISKLHKLLFKYWHLIENDVVCKKIFSDKPMISYKRHKNLADLLTSTRIKN